MTRELYERQPWLKLYPAHVPTDLEPNASTSLQHFRRALENGPTDPCVIYFDKGLDFAAVHSASDALAHALEVRGVQKGDRVAVMTQNVPQFVISEIAAWKLGAVMVPLNPMFKEREALYHLNDSGARAVIVLESLYEEVIEPIKDDTEIDFCITTSELDFLDEEDLPPQLREIERTRPSGTNDLLQLIRSFEGSKPAPVNCEGDDIAFLTYTSGTTGRPKGAMNTHSNVAFSSEVYQLWMQLSPSDVVLGAAPLFHITGLIAHIGAAFAAGAPLVLGYRFDAKTILDLIERHRCSFTVASITAFIALMNHPDIRGRDLASFRKAYSGGAPIPSATVRRWEELTGSYIYGAYGLTETTSPSHLVPLTGRAPMDPDTDALAVGIPVPSTYVRVVDIDTGKDLGLRELGEIWIKGPEVVPGYWRQPEATEESIVEDGYLRTGDLGKMDEAGWFYVLDRVKDMIICSGFKVWPREVEDYLYDHPAVKEAAVVGAPDPYRGETVKAFVSLKPGQQVSPEELLEFCRERMAAYKYPRMVEIVNELPKTTSGKLLRRSLRNQQKQ